MSDRAEFIDGLRQLAKFLEDHPSLDVPYDETLNIFARDRDALATIAKLSTWRKEYVGNWFVLRKSFGSSVRLDVCTERENVCRRVVVGKRLVPAQDAREEDVCEWVCDHESLLEPAGVQS